MVRAPSGQSSKTFQPETCHPCLRLEDKTNMWKNTPLERYMLWVKSLL